MTKHSEKRYPIFHLKTIGIVTVFLFAIALMTSGFKEEKKRTLTGAAGFDAAKDSTASVAAFMQVYKVLMSPRCMNCHPSGDRPLQGNDSHIHAMNVQRGKDGKGLYALKCSNCHQPENMKMVFQGRSAHDLALQIMDDNRNGHKNKAMLLEHARDTLVKAGWHMGEGRPSPPLAYEEFVKVWDTWINNGGYAPEK
jgi:mono/diheme cytochrome c family protein